MALVNGLQDRLVAEAGSADSLPPSQWEPESLKALTEEYEKESKKLTSWKGTMGPRGTSTKRRAISRRPPLGG